MWTTRWLLAVPVILATTLTPADAASIRDGAGLFSSKAIDQAQQQLTEIEQQTRLPVTIETVESLNGESVQSTLQAHAKSAGVHGLYILIAKDEGKFDIEASRQFQNRLTSNRLAPIKDAFVSGLKKRDFDSALLEGTKTIRSVAQSAAPASAGPLNNRVNGRQGGFGIGSLLGIGLLIFGVMFVLRLLGRLFGGGQQGYGGPGRMGAPGYGGVGGGGGFMSSLFGGIGGAMAGNWLYDQFSGRSHSYNQSDVTGQSGGADDWGGGGDNTADWGGGGGDSGGGDWGGGGGGDWGGGGGGGGGSDW